MKRRFPGGIFQVVATTSEIDLGPIGKVTAEAEWLRALEGIPRWTVPPRKIVLLSPHPDDEILGAGGLLAAQSRRTLPIHVIAATNGESAYDDFDNLAEVRRAEQERALAKVGVESKDIVRLNLPDGAVASHEVDLTLELTNSLDRDTLLVAPWEYDSHPDHEACGRAAAFAAGVSGAQRVSYFFWMWHHSRPETLSGTQPVRFDLDDDLQSAKESALNEYKSQLWRDSGAPILPEPLLAPARRPFETFLIHEARS